MSVTKSVYDTTELLSDFQDATLPQAKAYGTLPLTPWQSLPEVTPLLSESFFLKHLADPFPFVGHPTLNEC